MNAHEQHPDPWAALRAADVVSGEAPPVADDTPWYLAALIGVSAWIAAGFLFGFFVTLFDDLWSTPAPSFAIGAGCCVLAYLLLKVARGRDFIEQFAIATSLVGQLLIGMAFTEWFKNDQGQDRDRLTWLGVAVVALSMYVVGRLPMHRFLCGTITAVALVAICATDGGQERHLAVPLLAWAMLALWWRSTAHDRVAPTLPPMAWATSLVLLCAVWFVGIRLHLLPDELRVEPMVLVRDCLVVPLLPACAYWLSHRRSTCATRGRVSAFAIAAALALLWLRAPGVSIGVTLALLGFALYRPALLLVGLLGVGAYLFQYYYELDTTLMQKSAWLMGSGIALLTARWAFLRFARGEVA